MKCTASLPCRCFCIPDRCSCYRSILLLWTMAARYHNTSACYRSSTGARVCDKEEKESIELSIQLCKRIAVPTGWIKLTFIG